MINKLIKLEYDSDNVFSGLIYECVRCGTPVTTEDLALLPEIKCICGFRVFTKERSGLVKTVKAI